jgi:hypothetical protein
MKSLFWLLLVVVTFTGCASPETPEQRAKREEKERVAELKAERAKVRERRYEELVERQREYAEEMQAQAEDTPQ